MVNPYDVEPQLLIIKTAEVLKKENLIQKPEWSEYVKTGIHKERPPADDNWWYVRSAAVLRSIYKLGPIGVSKLRVKYGGRKNRGHKPDKFFKGSGSVIRRILQQLEEAKLVRLVNDDVHRGRVITGTGESLLNKVAFEVAPKKDAKKLELKKNVEKMPRPEPKKDIKFEPINEAKPEVKQPKTDVIKENINEKPEAEFKPMKEDPKTEVKKGEEKALKPKEEASAKEEKPSANKK